MSEKQDPFSIFCAIAELQNHDSPISFEWTLHFKPKNRYLTSDGYPLGTTCWYIRLKTFKIGCNKVFGNTANEAITNAIKVLREEFDEAIQVYSKEQKDKETSGIPLDVHELTQYLSLKKSVEEIINK